MKRRLKQAQTTCFQPLKTWSSNKQYIVILNLLIPLVYVRELTPLPAHHAKHDIAKPVSPMGEYLAIENQQ